MAVEVILRDDVPHLGKIGDVVRVKPGYARNFLFPRGLAIEASGKNLRVLEHQKRVIGAKADRERKAADGVAKRLEGLKLSVKARAGEEGRLAEKGFQVDRRRIVLEEPIKTLGTFPIVVQVGRDTRATIELTVEAE